MSSNHKKLSYDNITVANIRVIGENGAVLGVMDTNDAIALAKNKNLDLIEVNGNDDPPTYKIMDYGKNVYLRRKKLNKAKQKVVEVKEIKIGINIAKEDYAVKIRNAEKFIHKGNRVKIYLIFKGREIMHEEIGFTIINKVKDDLEAISKIEFGPKKEGKNIILILSPKK